MIESCYTVPLDQIPPDPLAEDEDPVYESLDEIASSQGSISNILGTVILAFVKFIQKLRNLGYPAMFCLLDLSSKLKLSGQLNGKSQT